MSDCISFENSICMLRWLSHIQDRISFFFNWIFKLGLIDCYFLVYLRERIDKVAYNLCISDPQHSSDALSGSIFIIRIYNELVCRTKKSSNPWCEGSFEINSICIFNHTFVKFFLGTDINNNGLFMETFYYFV